LEAEVALARLQIGEQREDALQRPIAFAAGAREYSQVLAHRQAFEDAALLRHETEAELRDRIRRQRADVSAFVADGAAARVQITHHRHDRCGLAGAVASKQADDLAVADRERHAMQDVAIAVIGIDLVEIEHQ